jgi:hypothetical protein
VNPNREDLHHEDLHQKKVQKKVLPEEESPVRQEGLGMSNWNLQELK